MVNDEQRTNERLTRMEVTLEGVAKQINSVVVLLDRMVRVEEHIAEQRRSFDRVWEALEEEKLARMRIRDELDSWRTTRKALTWLFGSSGVAFAIFTVWFKTRG